MDQLCTSRIARATNLNCWEGTHVHVMMHQKHQRKMAPCVLEYLLLTLLLFYILCNGPFSLTDDEHPEYPLVKKLHRRGKARASFLPPQLQCNYQLN